MEERARIMVVDDEERICRNVEKILKRGNYQIERATSAEEALQKMAQASFSLLISDIIMPGKNGLELLKIVKEQWPLTKAIMMTAYASTDTAVKAIRMGALDYVPKPFTPDELRDTVAHALSGELVEASVTEKERKSIRVIDIDIPFDREEVAKATGEEYADMLGPSDMPVVEVRAREPMEGFCETGAMVCDIFKKLGATCKAGTKTGDCPQKKAKKKTAKASKPAVDTRQLIGIDQPFSYDEVAAVTGPQYILDLRHDGVSVPYYEQLKENVARMRRSRTRIDEDIPFDRDEVARQTGEAYADTLGPSDMPVVEITARGDIEGFCETGAMVCDIFKKLGATCKAGTKTGNCPQKKAKKKKPAAAVDTRRLIGPDMPFDYQEVAAVTGTRYVETLVAEGVVQIPYEQLKREMEARGGIRGIATERAEGILVIDDEVAVNNNIRKILVKNKFYVEQAMTREAALEKIDARKWQLILLDLKIPGVRGLELLRTVTEKQPEARVIMITGYASIETAVEAARLGAVDYLPKPFTPAEIRQAADRALQLAA